MSEASRPFLTAQWRNLIMLNYEVDPSRLIDRVPVGTTLDCWHGKVFVSVLGFQFLDTKVLGAPVPFHQSFEEVNIRFYVRRAVNEEIRGGVVFIREIVPMAMVGGMARLLYREPYLVAPMRSKVDPGPPPDVEYQWQIGGKWWTLAGVGNADGHEPPSGSLEEFLSMRMWGYNGERGKDTLEYRVDHPRWRIWRVTDSHAHFDAAALCGPDLGVQLKNPSSVLIADGSAVTIHWRSQITT